MHGIVSRMSAATLVLGVIVLQFVLATGVVGESSRVQAIRAEAYKNLMDALTHTAAQAALSFHDQKCDEYQGYREFLTWFSDENFKYVDPASSRKNYPAMDKAYRDAYPINEIGPVRRRSAAERAQHYLKLLPANCPPTREQQEQAKRDLIGALIERSNEAFSAYNKKDCNSYREHVTRLQNYTDFNYGGYDSRRVGGYSVYLSLDADSRIEVVEQARKIFASLPIDCPPPSLVIPPSIAFGSNPPIGPLTGLAINTGLDGGQWCTYGDGTGVPTIAIPTDDNGTPKFPGPPLIQAPPSFAQLPPPVFGESKPPIVPPLISIPLIVEMPPTPPSEPVAGPPVEVVTPPTTSQPPQPPVAGPPTTPPSTPPSDKPPEQVTQPPVSTPPETPVTIFVKATQSVLEGRPTGAPVPGHNVALLPSSKPDLPFTTGDTQTAQQDTGFDKDPVKCTTGQGGECMLTLDASTASEYGAGILNGSGLGPKPTLHSHYRVDYSVPQTTGGVMEITGLDGNDVMQTIKGGLPVQVGAAPEIFPIGDRSYLRVGLNQPFGLKLSPLEQLANLFGSQFGGQQITDYCRDKQPGPPLGTHPASFSSLNRALPGATVRLRLSILDRLRALP
jgi:hypothetical protein